ncbi:MAG: type II toxin-antitoxin system RelE/ParE family toxin [Puniceicoccales bacterium]|nr:type II toxin-antitoxin system RelE/ParE family toxin [Puniceicoccales bacterium]
MKRNGIMLQDWRDHYRWEANDMHQITFSEQSLAEFNKMEKMEQLQFIDRLSSCCDEYLHHHLTNVQKFRRDNRDIYRCRIEDLRIYFEIHGEIVFCTYILHQHTLSDFVYRNKLPISETQMFEQYDSFWKYLETLRTKS